jgi:3-hydroxy-9,10-secoandrosta-1,3,5(10)-triene-9,17-dione monooxygenase reductase component
MTDTQPLRHALGRFATGITIVTCLDVSGQRLGLTVNSFQALSLKPALVLWSLRVASPSLAAFQQAPHFTVNVLAETQMELARRFASKLPDKFSEGDWAKGGHGAPVLADCAAVFECRTVSQQLAGDHVLFIGEVLGFSECAVPPLLFHSGHYRALGDALWP